MLESYYTIKEDAVSEIEIRKSRFICSLKRVSSEEDARDFIQKIRKEHWKANHHCSAYLLGDNWEIQRSSDDGEPSGTAGLPILEVLKKNELINVIAVVTRYFGGVKLGTGGLIRAYSHAVSTALQQVGIVQGILEKELQLTIAYPALGKLQQFLELQNIPINDTQFTDRVQVLCMVPKQQINDFKVQVTDLLNGQVDIVVGKSAYTERPVNSSEKTS